MPWLTVEQNVAFGLNVKHTPKDIVKKEVDEVLETVGLTRYKDYYPGGTVHQYDPKSRHRPGLRHQTELLLMDEPYGQLDVELRFRLEDELIRLWKQTGTTVLFITHNIEEAVYLSENILVLTNKPTTIKERIKNPLPRPRVVTDPEFIDLRNQVTELIKWW